MRQAEGAPLFYYLVASGSNLRPEWPARMDAPKIVDSKTWNEEVAMYDTLEERGKDKGMIAHAYRVPARCWRGLLIIPRPR